MNVILKQIRRKPVVWAGLLIALMLAVAVSLVGLSAWSAIERQASAVDENYITIAIMQEQPYGRSDVYEKTAIDAALNNEYVVSYDSRCMLGAEIEGSRALTSGAMERNDYEDTFDLPSYTLSVLAVTCDSVETHPSLTEVVVIEDEEFEKPTYEEYEVYATVNEVVSMAEGYEPPKRGDEIILTQGAHRADGTIPFEAGKSYLVFGYFHDRPITFNFYEDTDPATGQFTWRVVEEQDKDYPYSMNLFPDWYWSVTGEMPDIINGNPFYELDKEDWHQLRLLGQRDDGTFYYYPMEEAWTQYTEYTGSVADFLGSEAGRVWREENIPLCEMNQRSASMMLTDNLRSIYMFNNGYAEIVEGREMSGEEYVNGADVCLVSVEYAKYNDLHIGDRITADYHDTRVLTGTVSESGALATEVVTRTVLRHGVLIPENRIGVEKSYEIIGIYSAPAFRAGTHFFTADTIFAPKASLPHAEKYESKGYRALLSLILRNGAETEFFEALKHCRYEGEYDWEFEDPNDIDFSGDFMTFNQQYDKAAGNIEVMRSNARRLLILAILGFLIVLAAVRYFEARRQRAIVVTMKKLGIARQRIARELIGAGVLLDLTATALGGLAAWLLFGEITRRANVGTLQLPLPTLLISAAATAIVLTVTTVFSTLKLSRIGLMQVKK